MKGEFILSAHQPKDPDQWEQLAWENYNIAHSTKYDVVEAFFQQEAYFIQYYVGEELVLGYQFFYWESKRLPALLRSISGNISFFGEPIIKEKYLADKDQLIAAFNDYLPAVIKQMNPCIGSFSSYFGDYISSINIRAKSTTHNDFNIAYIPLDKSVEALWEGLHSKHRNSIRKGQKEGLRLVKNEDIDTFIDLLKSTYANQAEKAPNYVYIKNTYEVLAAQGLASLYFAYHGEQALTGALLFSYGKYCYYAFGGTVPNNLGAGNFLHWEIMSILQQEGFSKYFLGQVASGDGHAANVKFVEGISQFKRRFGTEEVPGSSDRYVFHPFKNSLWNWMKKALVR